LSAASPQYCFSHSMLASKPPAAATSAAGLDFACAVDRLLQARGQEHAVLDFEVGDLGIIDGVDAEFFGRSDTARSASPGRRRGRKNWCRPRLSVPPSDGCQRTPCSTIQFRMSLDSGS
jgi:hypothetical protein